jgi:hypothetical protein
MLVKKIDKDWRPDKQPDIKVGETIDITDPKTLILEGKVVAVTEEGAEISAYELYGVIVRSERKEFEEYLKLKQQKALGEQLTKENEALKTQVSQPEVKPPVQIPTEVKGVAVVPSVEVKEVKPKYVPKAKKLSEL